jgi:hypothetical protein
MLGVYLHDPRCICREAKTKTRRKNKEDMVLDSLFWPIMPYQVVASKLDTNRQPHVIQSYNVPPPQDDQFHRHDLAVYSIWMHFVDFCLANSESTNFPYPDAAPCFSAPDFPVNSYTKLPRLPVFRVLSSDKHREFIEIPRDEFVQAKSTNNLHIPMDEKEIATMTSMSSYLQSANTVDSAGIAGMYEASIAAAGGLPPMKAPSPSPPLQPMNGNGMNNGMRNGPSNRPNGEYDPYLPPSSAAEMHNKAPYNHMFGEYTPEKIPSFRSHTSPNAVSNMMLSPSHPVGVNDVKSFPSMVHPNMNMPRNTAPMNQGMYSSAPQIGYAGERGGLMMHNQSSRVLGMSPIPSSVASFADPSEDNTSTDSFEPTNISSGNYSMMSVGYAPQGTRPRADSLTSNDELDLPVDEHDAMIAAMVRDATAHQQATKAVVSTPAPSLGHPMMLVKPKELYSEDKIHGNDRTSPDTPSGLWHHQEKCDATSSTTTSKSALADEYMIEDDRLLSQTMSLPSYI